MGKGRGSRSIGIGFEYLFDGLKGEATPGKQTHQAAATGLVIEICIERPLAANKFESELFILFGRGKLGDYFLRKTFGDATLEKVAQQCDSGTGTHRQAGANELLGKSAIVKQTLFPQTGDGWVNLFGSELSARKLLAEPLFGVVANGEKFDRILKGCTFRTPGTPCIFAGEAGHYFLPETMSKPTPI
jgi:hypothetical protein